MQMALEVGRITIFARVGLQKLQEDARSTIITIEQQTCIL